MSTLKQILDEEKQILDLVLSSGGELTEADEQALDACLKSLCQKVDAYAQIFDSLEARAETYKKQANMFLSASKAVQKAQERLKDHMKHLIEASGKNELIGQSVAFKLSNGKPSLQINEAELDSAYFMQVTETVPDKKRIEEDLKNNVPVKGAFLKETKTLRRSVVK